MNKPTVTIYTRPGCHLCEVAKAAILNSGCTAEFQLEEINIDSNVELYERYRYDIPIVTINGIKIFKHSVEPGEFRKKLRRLARHSR